MEQTPFMQQSIPAKKLIIDASNIVKSYKVKKQIIPAVNDVSLQIYEGEFVALMGASGSGKSTLLQLLGGLDKPTSGNIIIDNVNIEKLSDRKLSRFRGKTIGFVFQFFYLQPFLRLSRNIEVPGMFARIKHRQRKMRIQQLSEIVGLTDRLNHFPSELSGGQIQRTAIIRALFNQPKILLADEPTGNLDSQNGVAILDLFDQVRRQFGTTIIVATHDPTIAARADRTITLKDGVLI
jgi:ABC-type lipoprotein export system ATPase subunit